MSALRPGPRSSRTSTSAPGGAPSSRLITQSWQASPRTTHLSQSTITADSSPPRGGPGGVGTDRANLSHTSSNRERRESPDVVISFT